MSITETADGFQISIIGGPAGTMPHALQDDPQWRLDRCGSVGASEIADATRRLKNGSPAATRAALMARKIAERLTGKPVNTYKSQAMIEGTAKEPLARAAYELHSGHSVIETGVVRHPTIAGTHASPDGLVGIDGVLEIKCPEHAAHLETLLEKDVDPDYHKQIQWQLACTGRQMAYYISYHPDFPPSMQLYVQAIPRAPAMITAMETEVLAFLAELEGRLLVLRKQYGDAK